MSTNLEQTVALLARTPATLNSLLRDLPQSWIVRNEGPDTWNVLEIVHHLIHSESVNWIERTRRVLDYGETRPFDSFDREGRAKESEGKPLGQLLDEFARLRERNLAQLKAFNLQPSDLDKTGRHPALGVVTLSQLLATWAAHDMTHLHQISRVMAHQYRNEVGPFSKFLGVLQCSGHSSS